MWPVSVRFLCKVTNKRAARIDEEDDEDEKDSEDEGGENVRREKCRPGEGEVYTYEADFLAPTSFVTFLAATLEANCASIPGTLAQKYNRGYLDKCTATVGRVFTKERDFVEKEIKDEYQYATAAGGRKLLYVSLSLSLTQAGKDALKKSLLLKSPFRHDSAFSTQAHTRRR
jgi:hypothetical protein